MAVITEQSVFICPDFSRGNEKFEYFEQPIQCTCMLRNPARCLLTHTPTKPRDELRHACRVVHKGVTKNWRRSSDELS